MLLVGACALAAMELARRLAWICDDAFISFRYAENLVNGLGLVFNAGERVEGYSNFLWTMLLALGVWLGVEPERWSILWGIAFHGASVLLLGWWSLARARARGAAVAIPVAALVAAAHLDWSVHATSGLETSMFTFLALSGFMLAVAGLDRPRVLALAGVVFGLAALTRPDGILLGAVAAVWAGWHSGRRVAGAIVLGGALLAVFAPFLAWRVGYYGDVFPNTYYAKSAHAAWFPQGWTYAWLYFAKYGALLIGPLAAAILIAGAGRSRAVPAAAASPRWRAEALLALALAAAYTFYVVRIGGDFMFARLLVPVTPFLLVLGEMVVVAWWGQRPSACLAATGALGLAIALTPHPIPDRGQVAGVVNERMQYPEGRCLALRRKGEVLRERLRGLRVVVAFVGAEARVVYYSKVPVAIECSTGLTDRTIARQPLARRGRVGHEKRASVAYLTEIRGVQIAFEPRFAAMFGYGDSLLTVPVRIGTARCCLLRPDRELIAALASRGARFPGHGPGALGRAEVESSDRLRPFSGSAVRSRELHTAMPPSPPRRPPS